MRLWGKARASESEGARKRLGSCSRHAFLQRRGGRYNEDIPCGPSTPGRLRGASGRSVRL